ncbi:MAG: response regulator transcription factor [Williamsia sp.]|nr:response regulator transcription factor [Williamsia sp.]
MEIKCIAIDDEPLALQLIREYIKRFPAFKLLHTFDDAIAGAEYLRNHAVDLLFIDINMPDITGLELVKSLQTKPAIIFTTAYKKFAIDGFDLNALDYLLKPISFERFEKAAEKVLDYLEFRDVQKKTQEQALFVRAEYQLVKINLHEIEYIESFEDYIKIHRTDEKPVMTLMTLKNMLEKLPPDQFQRVHRSYVVSLSKIRSIVNRKIRLTAAEIPISDSYADFISKWRKD